MNGKERARDNPFSINSLLKIACILLLLLFAVFFVKTKLDIAKMQEQLVEMELRLRTMALLVYETAWKLDRGTAGKEDVPLLKLYASREGFAVADMAMQLLGGKGFSDKSRVFACWKELRGYRIGGGTDAVMIQSAGRRLLGH